MACGGYKELAVLCFVYLGQIIQTADTPAVSPAVVHVLQAGVEEVNHCSSVGETATEGQVCAEKVWFLYVEESLQLHNYRCISLDLLMKAIKPKTLPRSVQYTQYSSIHSMIFRLVIICIPMIVINL